MLMKSLTSSSIGSAHASRVYTVSERWLISSNSRESVRLNKMDRVKAHELTKYNFVKFMIREVQTSTYKLDPAVKSGNNLIS